MTNSQKQPTISENSQRRLLRAVAAEMPKERLIAWGKKPELYEVKSETDLARICVMLFEMPIHSYYRIWLFAHPAAESSVDMFRATMVRFHCDSAPHTFHYTEARILFTALLEWWHSVREFGSVQVYKSGDGR